MQGVRGDRRRVAGPSTAFAPNRMLDPRGLAHQQAREAGEEGGANGLGPGRGPHAPGPRGRRPELTVSVPG